MQQGRWIAIELWSYDIKTMIKETASAHLQIQIIPTMNDDETISGIERRTNERNDKRAAR